MYFPMYLQFCISFFNVVKTNNTSSSIKYNWTETRRNGIDSDLT